MSGCGFALQCCKYESWVLKHYAKYLTFSFLSSNSYKNNTFIEASISNFVILERGGTEYNWNVYEWNCNRTAVLFLFLGHAHPHSLFIMFSRRGSPELRWAITTVLHTANGVINGSGLFGQRAFTFFYFPKKRFLRTWALYISALFLLCLYVLRGYSLLTSFSADFSGLLWSPGSLRIHLWWINRK
jgi:hypothetical protein